MPLLGVFSDAPHLCLVMPRLQQSLKDVLLATPDRLLTVPRAMRFAGMLFEGLSELHTAHIIHGVCSAPSSLEEDERKN